MNTDAVVNLCMPLYLLALAASFLPRTIFSLVTTLNLKPLTSLSSFKNHWFAHFWGYFGPLANERTAPVVAPLIAHATGVVLDIGPGQGHFMHLYAESPNRTKITKIYAVELNKEHHPALIANANKAGLGDVFEILDCPIELLESKAGIQRHSIDTIVTFTVLCSMNDPEVLIKELRTYLKPNGGKWLVYEHVRRRDNGGIAWYQNKLNFIWPTFLNGCQLTRDTSDFIHRTGGWDMEKSGGGLKQPENDSPWAVLPSTMGVLVSQ